ncbi:TetR family transcriptional regulator [Halobacillus salinarum]|uniref:TetR family transcriptional regulator n=1 Tax=Halobacillus salinarum TaxID=2932257 RepID=A0ABY4EIS2_9BACI|nr:TetR/AcrR family transcriptional regulator [Halobacillus salinarum]UOQ44044.1 TetR family transcriptional regulator [Halobacillus salinarum]
MKKRSVLSKEEILQCAETVFRRFGPNKTSVTDIAKELNISHGTIYRHYPSKEKLKEATTEKWLNEEIITPLEQLLEEHYENSAQRLKQYINKLVNLKHHFAFEDREMFKMYAEVTEQSAGLIHSHLDQIYKHLTFIIEEGMNSRKFQSFQTSRENAVAVFHATERFHHPAHAYEWKEEKTKQEFEQVWYLIERGIIFRGGNP